MQYLVKINQKAHILELKRRYFVDYCSDNQYTVSIKEDTSYLCLHSPKTMKETRSNTLYPEEDEHTAEDDIEVLYQTQSYWISAHNFLTRLQKLSSYAFGHLEEIIQRTMIKHILNEARAEHYLAEPSIESNDRYELGEELLKELHSNSYNRRVEEDMVCHIAKILEILNPIKVTDMDPFQLHMKAFPLSLFGKARKWWMNDGDGKMNIEKN
nr:hypothetical protein [Tanacetum cinerariifolium]